MMIQLQEGVKKYGLQLIVWSVLISMIIGYLAMLFDRRQSIAQSAILSTVNGTSISSACYEQALLIIEQKIQAIKAQFGTHASYFLSRMGLENPQQYAMNSLISTVLLEQVADKAGIAVYNSYIPAMLNNPAGSFELLSEVLPMSVFDHKGALSSSALTHYLKAHNSSYTELEQTLLQKVKQSIVQAAVRSCAHSLDKQLLQTYAQQYQSRSYAYFRLDQNDYIKKAQHNTVSDHDLKAFYQKNNQKNKRYWTQEQREGSLITFDADAWGINPTAQEIQHYYTHHKALFIDQPVQLQVRHIVVADEAQAHTLTEQLKKDPASFASIAQRHSQDAQNASKGGLMPTFVKGTHEPSFEKAAFGIAVNDQIAGPIKTAQGWEIIQRVDKTAASYKSLQQVQELIKQRLINQQFSYIFNQFMSQWLAHQTPKMSLEDLISQKHAHGPVLISYEKSDMQPAAKKLFSLKTAGQGFFVDKGKGILIKLTKIVPARPLEFEACKEQVRADYQLNQAQLMLANDADSIRMINKKLTNKEFIALADQYNQPLSTTNVINPADEVPDFIKDMTGAYQEHSVSLIPNNQGVLIVHVAEVNPIDQQEFEAKKSEITLRSNHTMQATMLKGFVASLYRNATISNDKSLDL